MKFTIPFRVSLKVPKIFHMKERIKNPPLKKKWTGANLTNALQPAVPTSSVAGGAGWDQPEGGLPQLPSSYSPAYPSWPYSSAAWRRALRWSNLSCAWREGGILCIQHRVRRSPQPPGEAGGVAPGVVHPIANHLQREDLHRSLRCSWGQRHQRECLPPVREDPLLRLERHVLILIFFSRCATLQL